MYTWYAAQICAIAKNKQKQQQQKKNLRPSALIAFVLTNT